MVGVSGDDVESHQKFKSELGIPFQLLADEGNEVSVTFSSSKAARMPAFRALLGRRDLMQAAGCRVIAVTLLDHLHARSIALRLPGVNLR